MNHRKIYLGGTYRVRLMPGLEATAKILRVVPQEEVRLQVRWKQNDRTRLAIVYEAVLLHRAGSYPVGFTFQLRSRLVLKLLALPEDGTKKYARTSNDNKRRAGQYVQEVPAAPEATILASENPPVPDTSQPNFIDMAKAVAVAVAKPPRQPASKQVVSVSVRMQVPLNDLANLLDVLSEYDPTLITASSRE